MPRPPPHHTRAPGDVTVPSVYPEVEIALSTRVRPLATPAGRDPEGHRTMQYTALGATGLTVSRIALGCGGFGGIGSAPRFFGAGESEDEARALMDAAWEMGITLFDTADAYGGGRSEASIGRWLRHRGSDVRSRIVLTTKVFHSVEGDPADQGLAPARVRRQIEGSL